MMSLLRVKRFKTGYLIKTLLVVNFLLLITLMASYVLVADSKQKVDVSTLHFEEARDYLVALAKEKGGEYAYNFLLENNFMSGVDLHLLGHFVGEQIYAQEGVGGMRHCTPEIQNACSHAIIVGYFSEFGNSNLETVKDACSVAPGGTSAYAMCFHGLGHGVLSYTGYNLEKTIEICNEFGDLKQEATNCTGGAVMEIINGGFHDRQYWSERRKDYISNNDLLAPCNKEIIPEDKKNICYIYITPNIFDGLALRDPNLYSDREKLYYDAIRECDAIAKNEKESTSGCYGGFGKEFMIYAVDRDIKKDSVASDNQLENIIKWCSFALIQEHVNSCIQFAVGTFYWGGENSYINSLGVCRLSSGKTQDFCYESLITMVHDSHPEEKYISEFCTNVPDRFSEKCLINGKSGNRQIYIDIN